MLRITVSETADRILLKLEGKLAGVWVAELEQCWRMQTANLAGKTLWADLRDVSCLDAAGRYLLGLMHQSGAQFLCSGAAMPETVQEICGEWPAKPPTKTLENEDK